MDADLKTPHQQGTPSAFHEAPCSEVAVILQFPALEKCRDCAGSGLTWNIQRRTKRQQVGSTCQTCRGTGRVRNTEPVIVDDPQNDSDVAVGRERHAAEAGKSTPT